MGCRYDGTDYPEVVMCTFRREVECNRHDYEKCNTWCMCHPEYKRKTLASFQGCTIDEQGRIVKGPLDKLIDGIRNLTELPREEKMMICNRCLKQDVCSLKAVTELAEERERQWTWIELDCRHREPATESQLEKMKDCGRIEG